MGKQPKRQPGTLGSAVRSRRLALRLTQRELADLAQSTTAAISNIEVGIRKPAASLLLRLARALDCTADELLAGDGRSDPPNRHIAEVLAAMKTLPDRAQREVVEFCRYQKHREVGRGRMDRQGR